MIMGLQLVDFNYVKTNDKKVFYPGTHLVVKIKNLLLVYKFFLNLKIPLIIIMCMI